MEWVTDLGNFRNRRAARAACLEMAAGYRSAAGRRMHPMFAGARPVLRARARGWLGLAQTFAGDRRLP